MVQADSIKGSCHSNLFRTFTPSGFEFTNHYDVMKLIPNIEWRSHVLQTPWKPPDGFSWPTSVHIRKGNHEEDRCVIKSHALQFLRVTKIYSCNEFYEINYNKHIQADFEQASR